MENQSFMRFIAETQDKRYKMLTLSELMILHYLRKHQKITQMCIRDNFQDALLDLAFVLHRAVRRVQRAVDAFQRPLFQKGAAKLDLDVYKRQTSWRVVPERVRFCCLGERSRRLPPTYCPQGVLLRVSYRASMW